MIFHAGHVYYIYCSYIKPAHHKFSVCIYPPKARFFWINTEPRKTRPDAQLLITPTELPCLDRDSYLDTGRIITFPPSDLKTAVYKNVLMPSTTKKIKDILNEHPHLTINEKNLVLENLSHLNKT